MTTIQILALSTVAFAIVILLALIAYESARNVALLGQDFKRENRRKRAGGSTTGSAAGM